MLYSMVVKNVYPACSETFCDHTYNGGPSKRVGYVP